MRDGAFIGPIIIAIGLIVAAICFAVVGALLQTADGRTELRLERAEAEISQLRSGLDTLRSELRDAEAETERLEEEIALAASRAPAASPALAVPEVVPGARVPSMKKNPGTSFANNEKSSPAIQGSANATLSSPTAAERLGIDRSVSARSLIVTGVTRV